MAVTGPKLKKIVAEGTYSDMVSMRKGDILKLKEGQRLEVPQGYIEVMTIDPEFAQLLLAHKHEDQRLVRSRHVENLAKAMAEGRWHATLDPIRMNDELHVIDGQHRLHAVVKSKTTQVFIVAILKDENAFYAIDQNLSRSVNDIRATLGKHSVRNTIRGAIALERRGFSSHRQVLSKEEQDRQIDAFTLMPELIELDRINNKFKAGGVGVLGAAIYCMRANRGDAFAFYSSVLSLSDEIRDERVPQAYLLYSWLVGVREQRREGRRSGEAFILESAFKSVRAWNAWRKGEKISKLQYDHGAKFPKACK